MVYPPAFPKQPAAPPAPTLPPRVACDGRTLILCGRGRAPDLWTYSDLAVGRTIDLALARVASRTASHTFAAAPNNSSLTAVLISNDRIPSGVQVGQWVLVGPVRFDRDGLARADHVWALEALADQRKAGVVTFIDPLTARWGKILGDDGVQYHWHVSQLRPG